MHSIPRILHFSTPDHPKDIATDRIESIKRRHPDWKVHVWTDSLVPENGRLSPYYKKSNSGAQLADLIRIDALWTYGGIYIDADFTVNLPLDSIADHHEFFIGTEDGNFPTNALFGATPGHPVLDAIIQFLLDNEPDWTLPASRATGPYLFKTVCQWRADVSVLPRETFYPYHWNESPCTAHRLSYATHLWDGSWLPDEQRHRLKTKNAAVSQQRDASRSSPSLAAVARGAEIEFSKFLSTIGFKRTGAALWNRAHGIEDTRLPPSPSAGQRQEFGSYTVGDEVFVQTKHGTTLICDGRDVSITPHLALHGTYEWTEELFLKRTLAGGDWFIDIGANVGNHAILAATCVGPFGRVFAFEPNTRCSGLMKRSAVLNWVHDRVKIHESGVSDHVGEAQLAYTATLLGGAKIETGAPHTACLDATLATLGDSETLTISTTTLDAAFPVDLPIKILKIDAEGHEPAILRGGMRLFRSKAIDFIMLEAIMELSAGNWHETVAAFEMLIDCGYKPARLAQDGSLVTHAGLRDALILSDDPSRTLVFHIPA